MCLALDHASVMEVSQEMGFSALVSTTYNCTLSFIPVSSRFLFNLSPVSVFTVTFTGIANSSSIYFYSLIKISVNVLLLF